GKRQISNLEQLAAGLRTAANAWAKIGRRIHDDRFSELQTFDGLEKLALDAERRLRGIRELGGAVNLESPWPTFVRGVAVACRAAGLRPTATGGVYDEIKRKPSWFQEFIVAVNE